MNKEQLARMRELLKSKGMTAEASREICEMLDDPVLLLLAEIAYQLREIATK